MLPINAIDTIDLRLIEDISAQQYDQLMTSYKYDAYTGTTTSNNMYPDYYGGAYINDNGRLTVVVVGDIEDAALDINNRIQSTGIEYESGDFSYNDLHSTKETILNIFISYYHQYKNDMENADSAIRAFLINFIGVGIGQQQNSVIVHLYNIDEETIENVKKVIPDEEYIIFEQRGYAIEDTSHEPGSPIFPSDAGAFEHGSMGFRCRFTKDGVTYKGFVTAGHMLHDEDDLLKTSVQFYSRATRNSSEIIGEPVAYSYTNATMTNNVDVAFIALSNTSDSVSSEDRYGNSLVDNYFTTISEGRSVSMSGAGSIDSADDYNNRNASMVGEVVDNDYSFVSASGVTLSDVLRCDYSAVGGDSGGVVYSEINGDNAIIGIHHGRLSLFQGFDTIVIKAYNIYNKWSEITFY